VKFVDAHHLLVSLDPGDLIGPSELIVQAFNTLAGCSVADTRSVPVRARGDAWPATTGDCPDGTVPVYRLFNMGADANHRYTTDLAVRAQMIAKSYVPEGYGPSGVAMCARP
jgi:hypothetical protein